MPPDPPTEAAMRLLLPLTAWLLEPPPIQNPGYATDMCLCVCACMGVCMCAHTRILTYIL